MLNSKNGAPEEIRTPDPQIRSLVLYPAELRAPAPTVKRRAVHVKTPTAMERYLTSERANCKPLDIETLQSPHPTIQLREAGRMDFR